MTSYADMARAQREERKFRTPEGDYTTLYKGFTYGTSGKGHPQITIELKPIAGNIDPAILKKLEDKKRTIKYYFTFSPGTPWAFPDFLIFLQDLGADLGAVRPKEQDPDFEDLRAVLTQAERTPPEIKVAVKHQKNSSNYNVVLKEVEQIFNTAGAAPAVTPAAPLAAAPVAPGAPVIPAVDPAAATVATVDGFSLEQMIAAGWTVETLAADPKYAILVPTPAAAAPVAPTPAPAAPVAPTPAQPAAAPAPAAGLAGAPAAPQNPFG